MERMMPKTSASKFYRELRVPHVAISAVIGKNGTNIQRLRNSPGISSVRLLSQSGKLDICGESEEAVHGVAWAIERRVCSIVAKDEGYHPDFFVYCFCKSLAQPLLAVDKICFQKFSEETSSETPESYLCFKSGATCEEGSISVRSVCDQMPFKSKYDVNSLCGQFSKNVSISETALHSYWDFSAYGNKLLSCLQFLRSRDEETTRTVKLMIRFGKQLLNGPNLYDQLGSGDLISLQRLQEVYRQKMMNYIFSTACSETTLRAVRLQLERLEYVKVSSRKKISIHVADLEDLGRPQRFNVSVRCDSNEGLLQNSEIKRISGAKDYFQVLDVDRAASDQELEKAYRRCLIRIQFDHHGVGSENAIRVAEEAYVNLLDPARRDRYLRKSMEASESAVLNTCSKTLISSEQKAVITRVRRLPKRHGFVVFCREGQTTVDFRLGVVTHAADLNDIHPEMVEWVEKAWRDRTPDQLFVFPHPGRFLMMNIRYKETETYVTEDWKFRISHVAEGDRTGLVRNRRWECGLSSRWFKWNDGITDSRSMESIMKTDVVALVKEAVKFSGVSCS
jgi:hypothetical protein